MATSMRANEEILADGFLPHSGAMDNASQNRLEFGEPVPTQQRSLQWKAVED